MVIEMFIVLYFFPRNVYDKKIFYVPFISSKYIPLTKHPKLWNLVFIYSQCIQEKLMEHKGT